MPRGTPFPRPSVAEAGEGTEHLPDAPALQGTRVGRGMGAPQAAPPWAGPASLVGASPGGVASLVGAWSELEAPATCSQGWASVSRCSHRPWDQPFQGRAAVLPAKLSSLLAKGEPIHFTPKKYRNSFLDNLEKQPIHAWRKGRGRRMYGVFMELLFDVGSRTARPDSPNLL